jgi:hypothetical protein
MRTNGDIPRAEAPAAGLDAERLPAVGGASAAVESGAASVARALSSHIDEDGIAAACSRVAAGERSARCAVIDGAEFELRSDDGTYLWSLAFDVEQAAKDWSGEPEDLEDGLAAIAGEIAKARKFSARFPSHLATDIGMRGIVRIGVTDKRPGAAELEALVRARLSELGVS